MAARRLAWFRLLLAHHETRALARWELRALTDAQPDDAARSRLLAELLRIGFISRREATVERGRLRLADIESLP